MKLTQEEQERLNLTIESTIIGMPMSDSSYTIRSNRDKLLRALNNAGFEIVMDTREEQ